MHRTTITLEKPVEKELRQIAVEGETSLSEVVNDLIKKGLKMRLAANVEKRVFQWHTSKGKPNSAVDISDRNTYLDLISQKIP